MKPGQPCSHPGCANHVTHPCEGCGRVAAGLKKRKAPWTDFSGKPIYEGDTILHPSGEHGIVVVTDDDADTDKWRVDYGGGVLSRLCLQIGDKGMGIVAEGGK